MDIHEKALQNLYEAKQPYEKAIEAVNALKVNRNDIITNVLYQLIWAQKPGLDLSEFTVRLKEGRVPIIAIREGDLRVDGQLGTPNSFWSYLEDLANAESRSGLDTVLPTSLNPLLNDSEQAEQPT